MKLAWQNSEIRRKIIKSQTDAQNRPEVKEKKSRNGKIAQNKLEIAQRKSKFQKGKNNFINKTFEEMQVITNKQSNSHKGKTYSTHIQWHWNRGLINVDCKFCVEQIMKEHS